MPLFQSFDFVLKKYISTIAHNMCNTQCFNCNLNKKVGLFCLSTELGLTALTER